MKRHLLTAAAVAASLGALACVDAPSGPPMDALLPSLAFVSDAACGTPMTVNLESAGGGVSGSVTAWNDDTNLHVVFAVSRRNLSMRETHLQLVTSVGAIPLHPTGGPALGQFQYNTAHNPAVTNYEYTASLASIGVGPGDNVVIAAIAMGNGPGGVRMAWGNGSQINPPKPAEYFNYAVQRCAPPPGTDVVVVNDINPFDANGMMDPNNQLFVSNLVNFTTAGPRNSAKEVVWDRGRFAVCYVFGNNECNDSNMGIARSVITGAGYTIVDIESNAGTLDDIFQASGANWKEIWLWTPMEAFDHDEINALKQFASEGGRVLYVGEWLGYYPQQGIDIENQFLLDMGAVMTNTGGAVDCGYNVVPLSSLRPHQITTGLTGLTMACSSILIPGTQDFPLYYDQTNTHVLSGVATIDVTPISLPTRATRIPAYLQAPRGLNAKSSTGR
ncbi:MAG: hypothetical protein MNPFHGCM_02787 [Gemmatimonadaceae bacterium]|nr:hypothetical protein [Gemmatimonadaceae bacterium]